VASDRPRTAAPNREGANVDRVRDGVRVGISAFVLILLITIVLGVVWTSHHQSPALRTASQLVLVSAAGLRRRRRA
jgi:hypothetical protein